MVRKIELTKNGVFQTTAAGDVAKRTRVAAPIRLRAIGQRENGSTVVQIRFKTMHGDYDSEFFDMADLLYENRYKVKERLANRGYDWPEGDVAQMILDTVAATRPARKFSLVTAPGWYGSSYVMADHISAPGKHTDVFIDTDADAHLAPFQTRGSLQGWQELVAKPSRKSCRLRLAIAAAFAAPFVRLLHLDSFGINLFSETSDGKTTALFVAGSVPGFVGTHGELPCWADSKAGIEGLARGHRDCVMPLDDTADGEDEMPLEKKARMMAFLISRNRARKLSRIYERNHNLGNREFRVIVISSSERALGQIARSAGKDRLGGEEVRLIDIPANDSGSPGIFDGEIRPMRNGALRELTKDLVENLKVNAQKHQGHAFRNFIDKYVNDPNGLKAIKQHKTWFEHHAKVPGTHNAQFRLRSNFAVIYAGAALAIDYGVLPWKKEPTFRAIEKCMQLALREMVSGQCAVSVVTHADIQHLAISLSKNIRQANILAVIPKKPVTSKQARRRRRADGFQINGAIYVKPNRFRNWVPAPADRRALQENGIIIVERADAATVERKIGGIDGKPRYFAIDIKLLDRSVSRG
jgi:hypothetical protein